MSFSQEYLLFFSKVGTVLALTALLLASMKQKPQPKQSKPQITVLNNQFYRHIQHSLKALSKIKDFKQISKKYKQLDKKIKQSDKRLYLLDFSGDIQATQTEQLRREIDLLLSIANPESDQVFIRLESRGGTITGYGLAASQVDRIRQAGFYLTISIDQIAASGGYLIASIAHKIIAAPFACIGSIGVVHEQPNMHQLLQKCGIKYQQVTAGKHKRTLSPFTEETAQAKEKVQEDVNLVHQLFQQHISQYRQIDIETVATGETWPAITAKEHGLVDDIATSDAIIMETMKDHLVMHITTHKKKSLVKSLFAQATQLICNTGSDLDY